jgi:hypothetical protein
MFNLLSRYQVINYNGGLAQDITTRIKFKELAREKKVVYYPYVIKEGERPEQIAQFYYDDPRYIWLVFLSNDIYDPYYDWFMSDNVFKDFIIKKYGSLESANKKIIYWRNNWVNDESIISLSQYSSLHSAGKKYWAPVTGYNNQITSYRRKEANEVRETNTTQELAVSNASIFSVESIIKQSNTTTQIAQATVKYVDATNNKIIIQHVGGAFTPSQGANGNIIIDNTSVNTSLSSVTTIVSSIANSVAVYWEPVSAFKNETLLNESKKFIKLVDKSYVTQIEKELDILL